MDNMSDKEKRSKRWKAYYAANKEKLNSSRMNRYWKDKDYECKQRKERRLKDLEKYRARGRENAKKTRHKDPQWRMWRSIRTHANRQGIPFNIDREDLVLPEFCPVLGIRLNYFNTGTPKNDSPSVDKVIPRLGYVKGNVNVISYRANVLKRDVVDPSELRAIAVYIEMHEKQRPLIAGPTEGVQDAEFEEVKAAPTELRRG